MCTRLFLPLLLSLLWTGGARAQSPSDGGVENGVYVNSFFHVSYVWPDILRPVDSAFFKLQSVTSNKGEFLLFMAREGDEPFGVLLLAQKPNAVTKMPAGPYPSQDFLEHVKKEWDPVEKPKILAETHVTTSDALTFYELDYLVSDKYSSAIVTQIGDYLLVFKCNARSAQDLAKMTLSALALQVQK